MKSVWIVNQWYARWDNDSFVCGYCVSECVYIQFNLTI